MGSASLHAAADIVHKYQGIASSRVISAVQKASARTGVDFAFLMEKASAESSFDPNAKAHHSSARGLYQFISDTWLRMVKSHGDKFGLGQYADQIEMKHGKPCVDDCKVRDEILNLRNNPEISALMAGAYSAENKAYLKDHTQGAVGAAELSLAHFMGAGGAAKFLNSRAADGDAIAADVFPREARLNKGVFYDGNGHARTFDQIYNFFGHKFTGGTAPAPATSIAQAAAVPARAPAPHASSGTSPSLTNSIGAQALPSFDDDNQKDDIIWSDDPRFHRHHGTKSGFGHHKAGGTQRIDAASILAMAEMAQSPDVTSALDKYGYNT